MTNMEVVQDKLGASRPSFVVGIGASAGGLEALEQLFDHLPPDTGMAFVVVQHLSPDFDSVMDELLVRHTELPVRTVETGMQVEPNSIYLIPPKKEMVIAGDKLLLTDKDPKQGLALPIDVFLCSLAEDRGPQSIGIILSGTGSDGSRGVRAVAAAEGLVLAQTEETAKFDGMPKSAVETGVVDLCLPADEMGPALARYAQHPVRGDLAAKRNLPPINESAMAKLLRLLRDAYGIDFSQYKQTTVNRRIERRLLLCQTTNFEQYVEQISANPDELNSLYRDLLIGVTQFFRDREAFHELDLRVLPELLQRVPPDEEIRMWVAGCATGEEAYSLAIILHEHLTRLKRPINVKIFATDVHQASLDVAGSGCYEEERLTDVSQDRLKRYFTRKGRLYQTHPELRQMIVFAQHNVLKDAPFTRLDLVSCRNLLIYFEPAAQQRALSLFHFGLKPNGTLLLGPSEGLAGLEDDFATVDRQWKIFRKMRDTRLPPDMRLPMPVANSVHASVVPELRGERSGRHDRELGQIYEQLLNAFIPSGLLLNDRRELVHVFGDAGKYLHHAAGKANSDAFTLLDSDLRTALAGAMQRAHKQRTAVSCFATPMSRPSKTTSVCLTVRPVATNGSTTAHVLVSFDEQAELAVRDRADTMNISEVSKEQIATLESELLNTKENLQATIEELEASNEELHATNEELVASNEELQSTNEELHSVNEELYTVNAEYQRKIGELSELTDDMDNLLTSTDVGVIFLDRELCIRKFTPQISRVFNILPQDVGRSFETFSNNLEHANLNKRLQWVLTTGQPVEEEVQDRFQRWYLLKILPYSSSTNVEGAVVTLIDITTLKKAEDELRDRDQKLQGILDHAPAFIYVKDLEGHYLLANRRCRRVLGVDVAELVGKSDYDVLPRSTADRIEAHDRHVAATGEILQVEETIPRNGKGLTYLSIKYPLRDNAGRMFAVAGIVTDITRRKIAQRRAKQAVKQRDRFLAMLSHELRNPLAAVKNGVEVLSRFPMEDPTARNAAEAIKSQADQMTRLMDDLLDVSRIAQGKIELSREVLDLREVAARSAEVVRSLMAEHRHEFVTEFPEKALWVEGDAARLQQIQVNLLVNAAKYTIEPGKVTFSIHCDGPMAAVRIRDTGIGMTEFMQKHAFEPFFQADGAFEHSEGGMGVGLTMVKSLVDLHGGEIHVESQGRGKGTEFIVRIPLVAHSATEPQDEKNDERTTPSLKILLAEDNEQLRYTTRTLLELEGHSVSAHADGLSALTAIEIEKPDVALVDLGLPELDGFAVAQRIRRHHGNDVYLVALTGYGQESDKRRAFDAGFDEHITKPFNVDNLRRLMRTVAERREARNGKYPDNEPVVE